MGYNVTSSAYVPGTGPLIISAAAVARLGTQSQPEDSIIDCLRPAPGLPGFHVITRPAWSGEGSGSTLEVFTETLARTLGSADIVLTWEGGDDFTGYRVRDGVVTKHKVVPGLGEEIKPT